MLDPRAILTAITLEITPDPVDGARIPLTVVPARTCTSAADLRRALQDAPVLSLDGEAVGAPSA